MQYKRLFLNKHKTDDIRDADGVPQFYSRKILIYAAPFFFKFHQIQFEFQYVPR
jgi:hypothetical protein